MNNVVELFKNLKIKKTKARRKFSSDNLTTHSQAP
jgi:hypothetical protein